MKADQIKNYAALVLSGFITQASQSPMVYGGSIEAHQSSLRNSAAGIADQRSKNAGSRDKLQRRRGFLLGGDMKRRHGEPGEENLQIIAEAESAFIYEELSHLVLDVNTEAYMKLNTERWDLILKKRRGPRLTSVETRKLHALQLIVRKSVHAAFPRPTRKWDQEMQ